jgi:hypothetical protein
VTGPFVLLIEDDVVDVNAGSVGEAAILNEDDVGIAGELGELGDGVAAVDEDLAKDDGVIAL